MNTREIIESGLLELYCIGATTPEETAMVKDMLKEDILLREEFEVIQETLENYAGVNAKHPPTNLLRNILDSIAQQESDELELPPLLSPASTIDEWKKYLDAHQIFKPDNNERINMLEFVQTSSLVTYIAWAEKGAWVEETHSDELERLFMLQGSCSIDFDGELRYYKEGDFIEIPAGTIHRAEATSDGLMILIGQRLAA